jgi:hypothetical protein
VKHLVSDGYTSYTCDKTALGKEEAPFGNPFPGSPVTLDVALKQEKKGGPFGLPLPFVQIL